MLLAKLLVLEDEKRNELVEDEVRLEEDEVLELEDDVRLDAEDDVRELETDVLLLEEPTHWLFDVHWLVPGPLTTTQALLRHSVWDGC